MTTTSRRLTTPSTTAPSIWPIQNRPCPRALIAPAHHRHDEPAIDRVFARKRVTVAGSPTTSRNSARAGSLSPALGMSVRLPGRRRLRRRGRLGARPQLGDLSAPVLTGLLHGR